MVNDLNDCGNIVEADIDSYFVETVSAYGGITKRIAYRAERGCADHLTGFASNRLFLVELKRPKGGRIAALQDRDAKLWSEVGVEKVYLKSHAEVLRWVKRVSA